jgi:hypothetical protein
MGDTKGTLTERDYKSIQDSVQSDAKRAMTLIGSIDIGPGGVETSPAADRMRQATMVLKAELECVRESLGVLMSYGIVICSKCKREVHQTGVNEIWIHCEDRTRRCEGAMSEFPASEEEIRGNWCGIDQYLHQF